jgi:phage shock protein PspC (stress-responsive transcriptional regulator)
MRAEMSLRHDDGMNDTQHAPPSGGSAPDPGDDFDPRRLRSFADMERSSDDRIIAGVCAGAARYLNVDPIVVRVVLAVLTVAGFAGVILYVAAWILLPSDDEDKSLAAEWFKLDRNEEQVRVAGLIGAVILAALSIVGNSSWAWWGDSPWWLVPVALVFYLLWVRPRRRREAARRDDARPDDAHPDEATTVLPDPATVTAHEYATAKAAAITDKKLDRKLKKTREPRSPALLALTTSLAAIALAATWIYDETRRDVHWTAYVAVALVVVAAGLLIGTFVGDAGPLIGIGILLAITLAIGSVFPTGRIGTQTPTPTVAADVEATYRHGIGELELDLTQVSDVDRLPGRTLHVDAGIGQTTVVVPQGLNVDVDAHVRAGQIDLFDRQGDGTSVSLADAPDDPSQPALRIDIDQQLGQIEVIRR